MYLAQAYHPDKFASDGHKKEAEEDFKRINGAYQILSNPAKRAKYNQDRSYQSSRFEQEERRKKQEAEAEERRRQAKAQAERRSSEGERQQWHQQAEARRYRSEQEKPRKAKAELGFIVMSGFLAWFGLVTLVPALAGGFFQTLGGITALLAGSLLVRQQELRRNLGFMMLSGFLIWFGLAIFVSGLFFFYIGGIFSLVSGISFVIQREMRKSLGFMMLSGFLILFSLSTFGFSFSLMETIMGVCGLVAGILFVINK